MGHRTRKGAPAQDALDMPCETSTKELDTSPATGRSPGSRTPTATSSTSSID